MCAWHILRCNIVPSPSPLAVFVVPRIHTHTPTKSKFRKNVWQNTCTTRQQTNKLQIFFSSFLQQQQLQLQLRRRGEEIKKTGISLLFPVFGVVACFLLNNTFTTIIIVHKKWFDQEKSTNKFGDWNWTNFGFVSVSVVTFLFRFFFCFFAYINNKMHFFHRNSPASESKLNTLAYTHWRTPNRKEKSQANSGSSANNKNKIHESKWRKVFIGWRPIQVRRRVAFFFYTPTSSRSSSIHSLTHSHSSQLDCLGVQPRKEKK